LFDQTFNRLAFDHLFEHGAKRLPVQTHRRSCEPEHTSFRVSIEHAAPLLRGCVMGLVDDDACDPFRKISSHESVEARELNQRLRIRSDVISPDPPDLFFRNAGAQQLVVRLSKNLSRVRQDENVFATSNPRANQRRREHCLTGTHERNVQDTTHRLTTRKHVTVIALLIRP
jgi:hypothetical protein